MSGMNRFLSAPLKYIVGFAVFMCLVTAPVPAAAGCGGGSFFFIEHWSTDLPCEGDTPAITSLNDFVTLAFWAVDSLLKLVVYIAVGFIIWGAVKYIKAQGEPSELASAKNTIGQAIAGLVIAIAAVAIVQFVQAAF